MVVPQNSTAVTDIGWDQGQTAIHYGNVGRWVASCGLTSQPVSVIRPEFHWCRTIYNFSIIEKELYGVWFI